MNEPHLYELITDRDHAGSRILYQLVHGDSASVSTKLKSIIRSIQAAKNRKPRAVSGVIYRYPTDTDEGTPRLLMRFNDTGSFLELIPLDSWEVENWDNNA